ncbi:MULTISPECIES: hypothetical protein [unclassified Caulobacter]|uniref:hypothetical protein n=1 Tax=unclassified Caulobacter TaxID=2648921 RepID=UPI0006F7A856|nr:MULTISPECIES: hypothetical protein [unclassified Caulobacter]KQV57376.1 hypothetical protein ASC62_14060 [Caulobacter sp. Root342]KQV66948.1 hypothetical protein ASC70_14160 [Caulobacter sp. Root343]
MKMIEGTTAPEVWLNASEYLATQPKAEDFDVFLHVAEPTVLSSADAAVYKAVDAFLTTHGAFGLHTVAETIFPIDEYTRNGASGVFRDYPEKLRAIQKARSDSNWGSYSYRILRQKDGTGKTYVPLEDLVEKIKQHGKYRASFELGNGSPFEDDIAIYDGATDRKRLYGGPCLSHLSIKIHDGKVRFNATYRSHYYVRRLLGNLVGLGRLQYFIARETGLAMGGLTINSTFARLDSGGSNEGSGGRWNKMEALELIRECRAIYNASGDACT